MTTKTTTKKTTARKTTRKFTPKSEEQKEAERQAAHDRLVAQVETLMTDEGWTNYLRAGKYLFGKYSVNNVLLILSQCPTASIVGAYRFWMDRGRCPIKGEGVQIFKFMEFEEKDEVTGEVTTVKRFPMIYVWDIQNTRIVDEERWAKASAKMDLTSGPVKLPTAGTRPTLLTGEDETDLGNRVAEFMRADGWTVTDERITTGANGYTDPERRHVGVRNDVDPAQRAKTLVHEAAHIQCGHTKNMTEYAMHRGRMECEAEGTAFVVAASEGLDTMKYSAPYLGSWAKGDAEMVKATAETVLKASRAIMAGIAVEEPEEEDAE